MKNFQQKIIDTYKNFRTYWSVASSKTLNQQIELWQTSYMAKYPKLLEKQVRSYEDEGWNWREIARDKVFSKLTDNLPLMHEARENILATYKTICTKAYQALKLDLDIIFVIYVGIGCGAGWATQYEGRPAILFGLENVAECGWHENDKIQGLMAHEIGHLAHMSWRNEWDIFEKLEQDPLFQLYSEGFAQRCEHVILRKETWHQAQDINWVSWCRLHKSWLAKKFLERLENRTTVRDFFGSWFNIQGKKQTGYFLGHAFVQDLQEAYSLREIAIFDIKKVRKLATHYLQSIAHKRAIKKRNPKDLSEGPHAKGTNR